MTALTDLAALIPDAVERLQGIATRTPVQRNVRLSNLTGSEIWVKREDLQPVRSYKLRGAYNLMAQLSDEQKARGVICASAGNHAQGVAASCSVLGMNAVIVVPTTTPRQKRQRIMDLAQGHVDLVLEGATYDAASQAAARIAEESGRTVVPAFNHPMTAAGQATAIVEGISQMPKDPDVVILPVGGGGLLSGAAAWLRTHYPSVRLIGVEPQGAPCVAAAISAGRPVDVEKIDTFIDGAAVSRVGEYTFEVIREARPELVRIPEGQVCTEMLDMYQIDGVIAEPAGALASAALPTGGVGTRVHLDPGSTVLSMVSGGNNDVARYAEVVERSMVHEGRKRYFLVEFPQAPGALRRFLDEVLGPEDDVTYFEYVKRDARETGPALVGVELGHAGDYEFLMQRIAKSGMNVQEVDHESAYFRFLI